MEFNFIRRFWNVRKAKNPQSISFQLVGVTIKVNDKPNKKSKLIETESLFLTRILQQQTI